MSTLTLWRYLNQRVWLVICRSGLEKLFSDELFNRLFVFFWIGKIINLKSPTDFNEKIQWLKLHYRHPLMPMCVDKYAVREYVKDKIGEQYLNKCLGVYDSVEEIDFGGLPDRFVLKATHGSGWNVICANKSTFDWPDAKRKLKKWMKINFSKYGREWQYGLVKPRIVCEQFLEDATKGELCDYKLLTFNGETKYIWVDHTSRSGERLRSFYDTKWIFQRGRGHLRPTGDGTEIPRPECLDEMIVLARKLASDFPQCRVDFYVLEDRRIVFGELTFSSAGGCNPFYPQSFCDELGSYIRLPNDHLVGLKHKKGEKT